MKRMQRVLLSISASLVLTVTAFAQEICDNGIDDNDDNRIDCYDSLCINNPVCDGFYLGNDALCEAKPPAFPQFTMTLDFASDNQTTNHLGRMAIGDLDRDGTPEIVTMNRYTRRLIILNGNDGTTKRSVPAEDASDDGFEPLWEVAIANIDNDDCAEIFYQGRNYGDQLWLYAFDCDLNLIWEKHIRTAENGGDAVDAIEYGLADFDGDGMVELYLKDMILDAHTGTVIVNTATTTDNEWNNVNGGPVAADIRGDARLELISGCKIYNVNLGTRAASSGSITLINSVPDYYIRNPFNATSVADYNQDGFLDVIASGSDRDGSSGNPKNTTVFFWDVEHDTVSKYIEKIPGDFTIDACPSATGSYYSNGWRMGTGRVNIADLDGDGKLNASYVSGKFLYALDHNFNLLWKITVNEETSGYTGCTLFDFNGDGKFEIVYRDERYLYIIDGTDGSIFSQQACISRTNREYPIVADVDADGSTELCVTCGFNDQLAADNFCDLGYSTNSHVRVFRSGSEPWVPARRVWNQHGYFNVNVNEDLTIPPIQQKHHLVWSTGSCTTGPNRPLNGFLNQSPFLNSQGCPIYASPNLAHVDNSLSVNEPTCPQTNFTVSFRIKNIGDVGLSGDVPITFYNGDPTDSGAIKLNTVTITLNDLDTNDEFQITDATVNGPGSPFTLYIVLNDAGTTVPTPIRLPNTSFIECDYDDNILSEDILPIPAAITALKVKDNIKCAGSTAPDNGAARAFVPVAGGGENSTDYNFYWSDGTTAKPIPSADFTGAIYTGLAADTFTVYAIHKTALCSSDTTRVTVGTGTKDVLINIVQVQAHNMCTVPPNGIIRAIVNGGEPPENFTYEWHKSNALLGPVISVDDSARNLEGKPLPGEPYTVEVTHIESGCNNFERYDLLDQTITPIISTDSVDATCSNPNSGIVTATVAGGITTGYRFDWYNGNFVKPTADHSGNGSAGATYNNRPVGSYTVVATNLNTQCKSEPVTVAVGQTAAPEVTASTTANQSSCDPALPSGSVTANVTPIGGSYSFQWFSGQNTTPPNIATTSSIISGLPAGIYTVKVTDDVTGCSDTDEATITNTIIIPDIIVGTVGSMTNCASPNGSITVNVAPGSPADYTFSWYDGPNVLLVPSYPDTDNVLSGLEPGLYTVKARSNITHCDAAPDTARVQPDIPAIQIVVDPVVTDYPDDCDSDGVLKIDISALGNVSGFRVEWYNGKFPFTGPVLFPVEIGVTSSTVTLPAGSYTAFVTNLDNGCTEFAELDFPALLSPKLFFISKTDVDNCVPDNTGEMEIKIRPSKDPNTNVPFEENEYHFQLYQGTNDLGLAMDTPPAGQLLQIQDGVLDDSLYLFSGLTPGFYTAVAISRNVNDLGCRTVPVTVEIEQPTNDPIITLDDINHNLNCPGAPGGDNGSIEISVSGDGGANPVGYNFEWFMGADTLSPVMMGYNAELAASLSEGIYTVKVTNTNTLAPSTGCISTKTFIVNDSLPSLSADVVVRNIVACMVNNGSSAAISEVREDANIIAGASYSYEWFNGAMASLGVDDSLANQPPGTYYAAVTNTVSNCKTSMIEFAFMDSTAGSAGVDLIAFTEPTRCYKDFNTAGDNDNLLGELVISPYGHSTTGYSFEWYSGSTAGIPADTISNQSILDDITLPMIQADTTFTVKVTNNTNQCFVVETYTLLLDVQPVIVTASARPVTFCDVPNGSTHALVTSGGVLGDYEYNWYFGSTVKATADSVQDGMDFLTENTYTVVAIDPLDTFCQSAPVTVRVTNARVYPVPSAMQNAPLSNCDPMKPNAVASASVGNDFFSYRFDWYAGDTDTGSPIYTGVQAGGLASGLHTIRATHNVSGCAGTTQITIGENFTPIPAVQIEILSHDISCTEDNGALTASVGGNTHDYIFHWYFGKEVNATADHTGEYLYDLPAGFYTVTATNRATGCVSDPATAEILSNPVDPEFAFAIINATCSVYDAESNLGQPDGIVTVLMKNEVDIQKIEWDINDDGITDVTGPLLSGVEAGTYKVTVTTSMGCFEEKYAEVKTEIHPFNGISRDGDGRNDFFHINCIDNFPDNIVRIYNRAGVLVFEGHGYDNIDVYFDGISNKGINPIGNNLPDGTYFYVIDKRDGTKPVGGYLEIVN